MHESWQSCAKKLLKFKKESLKFGIRCLNDWLFLQRCMLYFKEDFALEKCKFCDLARCKPKKSCNGRKKSKPYVKMFYFPLTPRWQWIYASRNKVEQIRWHHNNKGEDGVLCHPLDKKTWKHFDHTHSDFATKSRNVRLGLCADGFSPF